MPRPKKKTKQTNTIYSPHNSLMEPLAWTSPWTADLHIPQMSTQCILSRALLPSSLLWLQCTQALSSPPCLGEDPRIHTSDSFKTSSHHLGPYDVYGGPAQ